MATILERVDVVDEATSIRNSIGVLGFNHRANTQVLELLEQLRGASTLQEIDECLDQSTSPYAVTVRREIRLAFGYYWAKWIPEGTTFQVDTAVDMEVININTHLEGKTLPAGSYLMRVLNVSISDDDQVKPYPWLVIEDSWGMHLGVWYGHTWSDESVTLTQL
jgi:hypothetical protein